MDAGQYIGAYGGKIGGLFYLKDLGGFDRHLLPIYFIPSEVDPHDIGDLLPADLYHDWIFRPTNKCDHEGLVDVLGTEIVDGKKHTDQQLVLEISEDTVKIMRDDAQNKNIFEYCEYECQEYDGKIDIGVSPLNPARKGSVVEHPHQRGTYLIDLITPLPVGDHDVQMDRITVVNGSIDDENTELDVDAAVEQMAHDIVVLYQKARDSDFIEDYRSFQLEFGLNEGHFPDHESVLCSQLRPFLSFEEPPFQMDDWNGAYRCFGITPEEGIVLPVVKTFSYQGTDNIPHEFAWVLENMSFPMGALARPRNMAAFLPIGMRVNKLEHNTYKWVMKAAVSILDPFQEFPLTKFETGDSIRITSNGLYYDFEAV